MRWRRTTSDPLVPQKWIRLCRRKMCLVGPRRNGKTSLIQSLSETQTVLVDGGERTIGIDVFTLGWAKCSDTL